MKLSNGYEIPNICLGTGLYPGYHSQKNPIKFWKGKLKVTLRKMLGRSIGNNVHTKGFSTFKNAIKGGAISSIPRELMAEAKPS